MFKDFYPYAHGGLQESPHKSCKTLCLVMHSILRLLMLCKLTLTFKSMDESARMKATEQYFPVVLFTMLYKAVLTSESLNEIFNCEHSNESY